eukprot:scaffold29562_cov20-Tisochrysis_lutea.AAC.1
MHPIDLEDRRSLGMCGVYSLRTPRSMCDEDVECCAAQWAPRDGEQYKNSIILSLLKYREESVQQERLGHLFLHHSSLLL